MLQVLFVVDVLVQGHGLDAELAPEAPHGQLVDAVLIRQGDGGAQDPIARQRRAPVRRSVAGLSHQPSLARERTP